MSGPRPHRTNKSTELTGALRRETGGSADLSRLALGETPNEREQLAFRRIKALVKKRARYIVHYGGTSSRTQMVEQRLQAELTNCKELIRGHPNSIRSLYAEAQTVHDREVFRIHCARLETIGYKIGQCQNRGGRAGDLRRLNSIATRIVARFQSRYPGVLSRYQAALNQAGLSDGAPDSEAVLRSALAVGERRGIEEQLAADRVAIAIDREIGGLKSVFPFRIFARASRVRQVLEGNSVEENQRIIKAYRARYGLCLVTQLRKVLRGRPRRASLDALSGSASRYHLEDGYAALITPIGTKRSRGRKILSIAATLSPDQLAEFERCLDLRLRKTRGVALQSLLDARLKTEDLEILAAYRAGSKSLAQALRIHQVISHSQVSYGALKEIYMSISSDEALREMMRAYQTRFSVSLDQDVCSRMKASPLRDLLRSFLSGNREDRFAAEIRCALKRSDVWVAEPFLEKDGETRGAMIRAYNARYHPGGAGSFIDDLKKAVRREDFGILHYLPPVCELMEALQFPTPSTYRFVYSLVQSGDMSPAELIRYFMMGIGTDEKGIKAVLRSLRDAEIVSLRKEYAERYQVSDFRKRFLQIPLLRRIFKNGELLHDLRTELSGDDRLDIERLLSRDESADEIFCSLRQRYIFERGGKMLRWFRKNIFRSNRAFQQMDEDFSRVRSFYKKHIRGQSQVGARMQNRFRMLAQLAEQSMDNFRFKKHSLARFICNSAAGAGTVLGALPALFISGFPYELVAVGVGIASISTRLFVQRAILGRAAGREEQFWSTVRGLADGLSVGVFSLGRVGAMTLAAVGRYFGASLSKGIVKSGLKMGLRSVIERFQRIISSQEKAEHVIAEQLAVPVYRGAAEDRRAFEKLTMGLRSASQNDDHGLRRFFEAALWQSLEPRIQ